ncbi:hypothetical protein [Rhodococcus sp. UNC23MFCrub1.1]|uniref:hypothetical protein n=1 Tax=Rhodococcus sp. UNC23MFCrub1.1 TaxID=1449068 RepID=UPI000A7A9AC6|nr:hypothetical protein [Rhodococcus sp. UNC23MFCrub1.1]
MTTPHPIADAAVKFTDNPAAGFVPWIAFWVIASSPSTWVYGAAAAALAGAVICVPDLLARSPKMLDIATTVFFLALTVIGVMIGPAEGDVVDRWSNVISSAALAVIALGSLLFVPFTEQYARRGVPRAVWTTPAFKRINRVLTAMWGVVFAAIALSGVVAITAPATADWTNWVIPIVLLVAAMKFTGWYPDAAAPNSPTPTTAARDDRTTRA